MAIKIKKDGSMFGQSKEFLAYERNVIGGKIPSPFTLVEFSDSEIDWSKSQIPGMYPPKVKKGKVVWSNLVPLTPSGKPKMGLF